MPTLTDDLRAISETDHYFALVLRFPLRHIRSDVELSEAINMIDTLVNRGQLHASEQDYLDVLTDMVEKYEADTYPMPPMSDADMLRYLIDDREITQASLAAAIRVSDSVVSEILTGRRNLTRKQVGAVSAYFGVSTSVFSAIGQ